MNLQVKRGLALCEIEPQVITADQWEVMVYIEFVLQTLPHTPMYTHSPPRFRTTDDLRYFGKVDA